MTDSASFAERYEPQRELGRGSFGIVHLAQDTRLRRQVAIKVLHPQLSFDQSTLRLFDREAGTLAGLRHDHIITVYDAGVWRDQRYITMDYIDGPSLADVVEAEGAQDADRVAEWLHQAASALAYAHSRGVVHRDVKAANLLLEAARGRVYMTDFGLAKAVEASGGSSSGGSMEVLTGTAAYRAPEVRRTGHTPASDLYSLGVVAYELLAGRRPFGGNDPLDLMMAHATDPVPPLPDDVPEWLAVLVGRLLEKAPEERYADGDALVAALQAGEPVAATVPKPETRQRHDEGDVPEPLPQEKPADQPVWQQIGIEMMRIPAGEFLYGDNKEKVNLEEFCISKTPVTNMQYKAFVDATGRPAPDHWEDGRVPAGKERHPVVYVSWEDARDFCNWADVYLPTEQQWEKAARGDDGREYPWGNVEPHASLCNYDAMVGDTTPVDRYPSGASPYGVLDMAGNVWEWCADWYESGKYRVVRGGSFSSLRGGVRCASRYSNHPVGRSYYGGFRVVSPGC